jgi:hypothetical protein
MNQLRPPIDEQQGVLIAIVTLLGENRRERLAQQEKTNEQQITRQDVSAARLLRTQQP